MHRDDLDGIARAAQRDSQRLRQEFADHPGPAHCYHNGGAPWAIIPPCAQFPNGLIGQPKSCCWCGPVRVQYVGVIEDGHGPWVTYDPGSKIIPARG